MIAPGGDYPDHQRWPHPWSCCNEQRRPDHWELSPGNMLSVWDTLHMSLVSGPSPLYSPVLNLVLAVHSSRDVSRAPLAVIWNLFLCSREEQFPIKSSTQLIPCIISLRKEKLFFLELWDQNTYLQRLFNSYSVVTNPKSCFSSTLVSMFEQ